MFNITKASKNEIVKSLNEIVPEHGTRVCLLKYGRILCEKSSLVCYVN